KPFPVHGDEHVAADPVLTWVPAQTATSHQLYFGTDPHAIENATPKSPEFKGNLNSATFVTKGLNHFDTYYWRVDEVRGKKGKIVTKGEVWRFKVRFLAFLGAEGYGRFARCGWGGRVIEVSSLEDYDTGKVDPIIRGSVRAPVE